MGEARTLHRVLISAFEPFGGATRNSSQDVIHALVKRAERRQLTAQKEHRDVVLIPLLLPVEFATAAQILTHATSEHSPHLVISVGLAAGTDTIRLERVGLNLRDARIPDNAGAQPVDQAIAEEGEPALFSTLRQKAAFERITAADIPASLSLSAGSYVCNDVLYSVLHHLRNQNSGTRAAFVHVPDLHASNPPPTVDQACTALDLLISESLKCEADTHSPVGNLH
ncbi:pyroglutamyl-peptidase I family protein [Nesterenkonia haasae]|uniref:pyroglutamyl-peptidase I family protein n=1 Tax=Nesterenkonia haasae TaxID=2587813 RepID=UPI0013910486|nr:pyroglutamyl-peptidase I [Nesterenkonia haasae]NDK31990.1 pyroglutamyl-peptidase I [Nesterenkonia haasae]